MSTIDDSGFTRTRLDERLAQLEANWRAIWGDDIDLSVESPDGQSLQLFAEKISDTDALLEEIYNQRSPAGASGASLARLAMLNGVFKKPGSYSTAPITLGGVPGTVIPAGSLIGSSDTDNERNSVFQTTSTLTIGGGGSVNGTVRSSVAGAVPAAAGNLTVLISVVPGWNSAINSTAAVLGSPPETDPQLRVRRAASVAISSQGILDGLQAVLNQLADVRQAVVYENPTDIIDDNGLPRHSINVIVEGGDPTDIANAIWEKKSLGVTQVGGQSVTITDEFSVPHIMKFDRPAVVNVYVTVELAVLPDSTTIGNLKTAIKAWGDSNSKIGTSVIWSQIFIPINTIPGLSVVHLRLGGAPSPTLEANLAIAFNALATWDVANIDVVAA